MGAQLLVAKVVAALRFLGRVSLGEMVERVVSLSAYAASKIEASAQLVLLAKPTGAMCVFSAEGFTNDDLRRVQQNLLMRGEMVLGRTEIKGQAALKFTFMNPLTTEEDIDRLIGLVINELQDS